jgi:DNA-binding transcriptional ArsR family regulator
LVGLFAVTSLKTGHYKNPVDIGVGSHNHTVVDSLSTTLSALSDPTRRSILARLSAGPATVGELAVPFHISQQAVSKHLAYLERARLVEKRREGRSHVCTLKPAPFKEVADWVEYYRTFWDQTLDRLGEYLRTMEAKEERPGGK